MPRTLKSQIPKRRGLTAYPESRGYDVTVVPGPEVMAAELFKRPPKNDLYRTRYGRSLTLDRIQSALIAAQDGLMRDLTDMSRETIGVDPHLTSVLYKRFNSVASLPWECRPAEGPGVDPKKAQAYADFVREQLLMVSNFRKAIVQLAWGLFDGRAALEVHWIDRPETYTPKGAEGMTLQIKWRVGSLGWIHPRRLCFDEDRNLYINDTGGGTGFDKTGFGLNFLPFKFIQFTPQLFGDYPELEGLAPKCLYWAFMKRFGARERMVLVELFGKPWRVITVDENSDADAQDLQDAAEIADQLGGNNGTASARMPRGTKLEVFDHDPRSGELHEKIIETSDKQLSKLVLGQTGTTDAQPGALGGGLQALVMSNEQFVILNGDAAMLGEAIEDYLTDAIIELNFGRAELINAPRFVLRAETNPDKKAEAERMKIALDMGLPIEIDEAYEVLGFKKPEPGSIVLQVLSTPGPMGTVERSSKIIVAPAELAQQQAEIDAAIREAAAPQAGPAPIIDPNAPPPANDDDEPAAPAAVAKPTDDAAGVIKDVLGLEQISRDFERILLAHLTMGDSHSHNHEECVALAKNRQPDSVHGTLETLIDKGVREAARVSGAWCEALTSAVRGETTPVAINRALQRAADRLDLLKYARTIERRMTHSAMTGALDSQWEDATDSQIKPEAFPTPASLASKKKKSIPKGPSSIDIIRDLAEAIDEEKQKTEPDFTGMAYQEATKFFKSKQPIPKAIFEKLSSAAKARSFTVAGLASEHLLSVAHSELTNAIVEGSKMSDFAARLEERFKSAGVVQLNPSHVETIFRTNLLTSYNVGRKAEMTTPDALKLRPYWVIRGVSDDRQRDTHRAVNGWVLRATDPFWRTIGGPPFGFNCFAPSTLILGNVIGAARSTYRGPGRQITTAKGRRLTVTANHPILTERGFLPAHAIRKGDNVASYCIENEGALSAPGNKYDSPMTAEQVFAALAESLGSSRTKPQAGDFHGEAKRFDGEIEVVGSYGKLLGNNESAGDQGIRDLSFVNADAPAAASGSLGKLGLAADATSAGSMGSSELTPAFSGAHAGPLDELRLRLVSQLDAVLLERSAESIATDLELDGERVQGDSAAVLLDEVVDVVELDLSGHVYDFETSQGWLVADGIIASNCRCRTTTIRADKLGSTVVRIGAEIRGLPDPGFDPVGL